MKNQTVFTQILDTPLGEMTLAATDAGVCLLEFNEQSKRLEDAVAKLKKRLSTHVVSGENPHIEQTKIELNEYFNGKRQVFNVGINPQGTVFQQSVWQVLCDIPYGETVSYLQQAQSLKKPNAVRAVANANGANHIAIIIPCHRVIGSNGKLTGYGGGIERKRWLLDWENRHR